MEVFHHLPGSLLEIGCRHDGEIGIEREPHLRLHVFRRLNHDREQLVGLATQRTREERSSICSPGRIRGSRSEWLHRTPRIAARFTQNFAELFHHRGNPQGFCEEFAEFETLLVTNRPPASAHRRRAACRWRAYAQRRAVTLLSMPPEMPRTTPPRRFTPRR